MNDWRMGRWAVLDTETTGLTGADRICEIAVVIMQDGRRLSAWSSLVNPGIPIPADATSVHGITNEMVLAAPTIQQLRIELASQLAGADAIVGYHSYSADFPWLERELPGILPVGPVYVDALVIVRKVLRGMKGSSAQQVRCPIWTFDEDGYVARSPKHIGRHSLGNVVDFLDALANEPDVQSKLHRAEFDADCTGRVLNILRKECNGDGRAFERWARAEHERQMNSLEQFFAGLRAQDAAKRSARQTFEERLTAMVGEHFAAINARLDALTPVIPATHTMVQIDGMSEIRPVWMAKGFCFEADALDAIADEAQFADVGLGEKETIAASHFLRGVANRLRQLAASNGGA